MIENKQLNASVNESIIEPLQPNNKQLNASVDTDIVLNPPKTRIQNQQSIKEVQIDDVKQAKSLKRLKWGMGLCTVCFIIFLLVALVFPVALDRIIRKKAVESSMLTKANEKQWSQIPGETGSQLVRNYAFFNFTNPEAVLLRGQKPEFLEIKGYGINELQDYVDIQYLDNEEHIKFNYWLHFKQIPNSRDLYQKVKVLNLGPLGYWYQLKNANRSLINIQGIGILFTNLQSAIVNTALGQGISSQFLPDFNTTYNTLLAPAQISLENANFIWNDPGSGMGNPENLDLWLQAAQDGLYSKTALDLGNYFTLEMSQLHYILDSFKNYEASLSKILFDNYYCFEKNCSGFSLAVRQIAGSSVTNNPPPTKGVSPTITICENNSTCAGGYPQLWSYYTKVFLPKGQPERYQNLTFDPEMVENWFTHTTPVNKKQNCLLHAGNLDALWNNGTLYDLTSSDQYLGNIKNRFGLASLAHAHVFWHWIKYFTTEFVNKQPQGGNNQVTGIGNVASKAIFKQFTSTQNNLHILLLKYVVKKMTQSTNCQQLVIDSIRNVSNQTVQSICAGQSLSDLDFIEKLIRTCKYPYNEQWVQLGSKGVSNYQLISFCDRTQEASSFGYIYQNAEIYLNDQYECDITPNKYCSDYEIAAMQWSSSYITLNPIPQVPFKGSKTVHQWIPQIAAFQYQYFKSIYKKNQFPNISTIDAYRMISFDVFFSGPVIQTIYLEKNTTRLEKQYRISNKQSIVEYLRYLVIFVGFGGMTQQRTPYQLMFGYKDPFVSSQINEKDPALGGDPSAPSLIHFNDLNISREEAKYYPIEIYSGKNHPELTNFYYKINGQRWQNFNKSKWNGNQTVDLILSPWEGKDYFYGTNAKQYPADQFNVKNVSIYVTNIYRYGDSLNTGQTYQKYGFHIIRSSLSQDIGASIEMSDRNAKYYQTFPNVFNLTSIQNAPIFGSNNHFYKAENWTQYVNIWDQTKSFIYTTNKWDQSFVDYEPYSGVNFQAVLYLQMNYLLEVDELFRYNQTCLLPLFSIYRAGNFSQHGAQTLLKPLKLGLGIKKISVYVGACLAGFSGLCTIGFGYMYSKKKKQQQRQSISISLQQKHDQEQFKESI